MGMGWAIWMVGVVAMEMGGGIGIGWYFVDLCGVGSRELDRVCVSG